MCSTERLTATRRRSPASIADTLRTQGASYRCRRSQCRMAGARGLHRRRRQRRRCTGQVPAAGASLGAGERRGAERTSDGVRIRLPGRASAEPQVQQEVAAIMARFLTAAGWRPAVTKTVAGALLYTRYNPFRPLGHETDRPEGGRRYRYQPGTTSTPTGRLFARLPKTSDNA